MKFDAPIARTFPCWPGEGHLSWAQPSVTAPIASATNVDQLQELLRAAELKLDRESLEKLNQASAYAAGVGAAH